MKYSLDSTAQYDEWFDALKDRQTRARVVARLARIEMGNLGDHKQLSNDLWELRFTTAGGLRIYYAIRDEAVVLLLCGGNKTRQSKDIARAEKLIDELE